MINALDYKYIGYQKAIDDAIGGTLFFPNGTYHTEAPLLVAKKDELGNYKQVEINIIGENSNIICHHTSGYGIGIQQGKKCKISGIEISGQFTTPKLSDKDFYNSDFDSYTDGKCQDTRYEVYSGFVIDPHKNPNGGNAGSSRIKIEDCMSSGFVSGFTISPNGDTRNAEMIHLTDVIVKDCKSGFIGCHDQEKQNTINNFESWGVVHTAFVFNKYGAKKPGHYTINGANLAGKNANLIYRSSGSAYPIHMYDVFAESLGQLGTWETSMGDSINNSIIHYQFPENMGGFPVANLLGKGGVKFNNTVERYYGKPKYPVIRQSFNPIPCPDLTKHRLEIINNTAKVTGTALVGDVVQLLHHINEYHISPAVVTEITETDYTISMMNKNVKNGGTYKINRL